MKKVSHSMHKRLGPVTLFVEDLEQIDDCMRADSEVLGVTNETATTEYESLQELGAQQLSRVPWLAVASQKELFGDTIEVLIGRRYVTVSSTLPSMSTRLAYGALIDLLARRQRLLRSYPHLYTVGLSLCASAFAVSLIVGGTAELVDLPESLFSIGVLIMAYNLLASRLAISKVYFCHYAERPSFWRRKGDDVALEVIKALLAAAFGSFVTLLVQGLVK